MSGYFKHGDFVAIVEGSEAHKLIGLPVEEVGVGMITQVYEWHSAPYEVKWHNNGKYKVDLFHYDDLRGVKLSKRPEDYIDIQFQEGEVNKVGVNGVSYVDVVDFLIFKILDDGGYYAHHFEIMKHLYDLKAQLSFVDRQIKRNKREE